jgi:hypothetical protein
VKETQMNVLESILSSNSGVLGQIAKKVGVPEPLAKQAVAALAPALVGGLARNVSQPGGLEALTKALGVGSHQKYLDEPDKIGEDDGIAEGNAILGHILGSKEVSRKVAGAASRETGVDTSILKKMLPMVADVTMGALSKRTSSGAALGASGSRQADPFAVLSGLLGGQDSGSSADDLLKLAKRVF